MTLNEAIKHVEEVADVCEFEANKYDMTDSYERSVACREGECAKEHRQLAEWLKDYRRLLKQEPCEDAISRQTVNELRKYRYNCGDTTITCVSLNSINELPSVTPQPKTEYWISVNERLPKEFESVLVCYKSQGGMAQCVSERLVNMDGSNRWSAMYGQEPIAWMPLPKPYKAESEE